MSEQRTGLSDTLVTGSAVRDGDSAIMLSPCSAIMSSAGSATNEVRAGSTRSPPGRSYVDSPAGRPHLPVALPCPDGLTRPSEQAQLPSGPTWRPSSAGRAPLPGRTPLPSGPTCRPAPPAFRTHLPSGPICRPDPPAVQPHPVGRLHLWFGFPWPLAPLPFQLTDPAGREQGCRPCSGHWGSGLVRTLRRRYRQPHRC